MLRHFVQRAQPRRALAKPRLVVCVPSGITGVERRAVEDAGYAAGARQVYLIEEPMAAAIGAGLPVYEAAGSMIVDIGGGTTEVAVVSLGGVVVSMSARVGGDAMDDSLVQHMKKHYSAAGRTDRGTNQGVHRVRLSGGRRTDAEIRGRDLVSGLPRTIVVSAQEIREALEEPVTAIVDAVRTTLDRTPPELAGDVMGSRHRTDGWRCPVAGSRPAVGNTRLACRCAPPPDPAALRRGRRWPCVEGLLNLQSLLMNRPRR